MYRIVVIRLLASHHGDKETSW